MRLLHSPSKSKFPNHQLFSGINRGRLKRMDNYHCPIYKDELEPIPRYPQYICENCAKEAKDEAGRLLKFYNIDVSGGYMAKYVDTNEEYESHICYINGIKCYADEARFGGIVIMKK